MAVKRKLLVLIAILLLSCIAVLCIPGIFFYIAGSSVMTQELSRITSPNGKIDAVLLEHDSGATTSVSKLLYILPAGQKPEKNDLIIFVADHVEELAVYWKSDNILQIQYKKARIFKFRNHVRPIAQETNYLIEILEMKVPLP